MNPQDELRDLWCSQSHPGPKGEDMLAVVIERTRTLDRRIAVRNALEIVASLIVVAFFAFVATKAPSPLEMAGSLLVAASGAWIAFYVWRKGTGPSMPVPDADLHSYEALLLENYDHQIRLLKSVKYWYLLPPYLGLFVGWIGHATRVGWDAVSWADYLNLVVFTSVFICIWILNEVYGVRHLRRLKQELIDSLNARGVER
jgi:hypothetical protein